MTTSCENAARSGFARVCTVVTTAGVLLLGGLCGMAQAQSADAGAAAAAVAAAPEDVTEVVVTGSRIRGAAPVGSTVDTVSREDIEVSGATTTTQLLQQLPQIYNLGVSESSRGQSGGASNITYGSSINLLGIGPYATLTLLDGHRAVPQGTTGFAVDPSVIPTLALERVEVVDDGASAIYGSDAVAGVVNLILRRRFEGIQVSASGGTANDYNEHQAGVLFGHVWSSGQATLAFQNSYHSSLNGTDRDFYRGNLTGSGGGDFRVPQCNPGNILIGTTSYAIPAGGVTPANANLLVAGTTNKCDNLKYADLLPEQTHNSAVLTFNQALGSLVELHGDAFMTRRSFQLLGAYPGSGLRVPTTNAFFVTPPGVAPATETVNYSFVNDYPHPYTEGFSRAYEGTFGVSVQLPARWKFDADYTFGFDKDDSVSHSVANAAALTAALASSNPATAFNPFGGGNSASVINSILIGYNENPGQSILRSYEGKFDGPLFHLPADDVRAAVGYEGQDFSVAPGLSSGTVSAPVITTRHFNRRVNSVYGEILVPLFGPANALPGMRKLNIDIADRYDRYSDVGNTTNPKFGLDWSPIDSLTVRGSYGTSFRAPTIAQIYGNTNTLFVQNYSDPTCACVIQGVTRSGGNLNLKPETATTWTAGVDFEPVWFTNSKFSLTYFDIDYANQVVSYLPDLTVLQREAQFAGTGLITRNPSAALIAEQVAETHFTGVLPNPVAVFVDGRNLNLGRTVAKGVDFDFNYRVPQTALGNLQFGVSGTYFTSYLTSIAASAPQLEVLNHIYNPLRFKARGTIGLTRATNTGALFVNYVNSYLNNLATTPRTVSDYTTVDLHLGHTFPRNLTLSFDARNLFDAKPPFVNIAESANGGGGFDATVANPVGRVASLGLVWTH